MTPEGRVKAQFKRRIKPYIHVYQHWPVPSGFGKPGVDCYLCVPIWLGGIDGLASVFPHGAFCAIEFKAPGKVPTPLQQQTLNDIQAARGMTWVISDDVGMNIFFRWLEKIYRGAYSEEARILKGPPKK